MTENRYSAESQGEAHEQMYEHVERIDDELDQLERLAEDCEIPAIERNATQLRGVLQSVAMNLPPRSERDED